MPRIYTRSGDSGETGLFRGPRVDKDCPRIEAYGTVDELNSLLGWLRATGVPPDVDEGLCRVQRDLFHLGAELATVEPGQLTIPRIAGEDVSRLESWIDKLESDLPPMQHFVLPGGTNAAAAAHVVRAVCRRAERRLVTLGRVGQSNAESVSPVLLTYLNRLSDYLFVLARWLNHESGVEESRWGADNPPS